MQVAERFGKSITVTDLGLTTRVLYQLAAPSTPDEVVTCTITAAQRAHAIKRRKVLWEQRHPKEVGGTTCSAHQERDSSGRPKTPQQSQQFAADTAERTGQSKQDVNRHISRADALGDDLEAITGTIMG